MSRINTIPSSLYYFVLRGPGHYPYLPVRTAASGPQDIKPNRRVTLLGVEWLATPNDRRIQAHDDSENNDTKETSNLQTQRSNALSSSCLLREPIYNAVHNYRIVYHTVTKGASVLGVGDPATIIGRQRPDCMYSGDKTVRWRLTVMDVKKGLKNQLFLRRTPYSMGTEWRKELVFLLAITMRPWYAVRHYVLLFNPGYGATVI